MSVKDGRTPPFIWAGVETLQYLRDNWSEDAGARLPVGRSVYIALCELANEEHARANVNAKSSSQFKTSRSRIVEQAGASDKPVDKALRELERLGLIAVERTESNGARPGAISTYTIHESSETCGASPDVEEAPKRAEKVRTSSGASPDVEKKGAEEVRTPPYKGRRTTNNQEPPVVPQEGDAFAEELFELWKRLTGRNATTKFSPKRRRAVRMRLKDGMTEDQIRRAVIGCTGSDWHMKRGKHANRDGQRHDNLTFILRNIENVERFAEMAGEQDPRLQEEWAPVSEGPAATKAWEEAKARLRASLPESTYKTWIECLEAAGERDGKLVLLETRDQGAWVERRYKSLIWEAVQGSTSDYTGVEIIDPGGLELEER